MPKQLKKQKKKTISVNWFSVQNAAADGPVEIAIYDQIGKDWWDGSGVEAKKFADELKKIPKNPQVGFFSITANEASAIASKSN